MKTKLLLTALALLASACSTLPTAPTKQSVLTVEVVTGPETSFVPAPDVAVILYRPDGTADSRKTDERGRIEWKVAGTGEHTVHVHWNGGYYQMRGEVTRDETWRAIAY